MWFAQHLPKVLAEIGSFDVVSLQDIPDTMDGYARPLKTRFNMKAPNRSYAMELYADHDALFASKRSSESRRSSRKRDSKLAGTGTLSFGLPETKLEAHRILDDMFEHQAQRLAELGYRSVLSPPGYQFPRSAN